MTYKWPNSIIVKGVDWLIKLRKNRRLFELRGSRTPNFDKDVFWIGLGKRERVVKIGNAEMY